MKTKFMGIMGGIVLAALVLITPITAKAQVTGPFTTNVNIVSVAQDATTIEIRASNVVPTGFQNARFVLAATDATKSQLAILLTAMSTGKTVQITFTSGNAPVSNIISRVLLTN